MKFPVHLRGPAPYRVRFLSELCQILATVPARRLLHGPRRPGWNWFLELSTEVLKRHLAVAFKMPNADEARIYLDCFQLDYPDLLPVEIVGEVQPSFRGDWYIPDRAAADTTLLYFHGGGYSFYPKAYENFVALIANCIQCRTFSLAYRLAPESRFPAQLEDAFNAYRWLLETGHRPETIALAGDSAGGHLTLTLLLKLRDSGLPLPALGIVFSPATDFMSDYRSITANEPFDWINSQMLTHWAGWFCAEAHRCEPLVSPLRADLRGLPPVYMQAGEAEILFDSIQAFADHARRQGADVTLESWRDMNHVFQMFGPAVPQAAEALERVRVVFDRRMRSNKTESFSNALP